MVFPFQYKHDNANLGSNTFKLRIVTGLERSNLNWSGPPTQNVPLTPFPPEEALVYILSYPLFIFFYFFFFYNTFYIFFVTLVISSLSVNIIIREREYMHECFLRGERGKGDILCRGAGPV